MTPTDFFIFINELAPFVRHNLHIVKGITSAGFTSFAFPGCLESYLDGSAQYAPQDPDPNDASKWVRNSNVTRALSMSSHYHQNYIREYEGEKVRLSEFALLPSRFSGTFAFPSMNDCDLAHQRHGWKKEEIREFKLLPHQYNRVLRASMDLASLVGSEIVGMDDDQRLALWRLYWQGRSIRDVPFANLQDLDWVKGVVAQGEIWECLIEGHLELQGPAPSWIV
ncbi:MAG: hypothetical protein QOJ15_3169 [Bradyrhizobium sp.]|nr:hypothetical protein [Bradyrhizobium sp.]